MQNINESSRPETIPALWRLGFRPFFLAGSLLAALAVPFWLISLYYPQHTWLKVLPFWWHPHELLFGFAMDYEIICITLEPDSRKLLRHPVVEHMVQEDIGQQR